MQGIRPLADGVLTEDVARTEPLVDGVEGIVRYRDSFVQMGRTQ